MSLSIALPPNKQFPHAGYYSIQPFLAWCLNHYFYNEIHYVWASQYFFPYRKLNPKSSNPYQMFQDLYQPCVDRDPHDAFIQQKRIKLRAGVDAVIGDPQSSKHQHRSHYYDLLYVCDNIDETFFWPVVYLIDGDVATNKKGEPGNSALVGSDERLIKNLAEDEFTIILPDFDREAPLSLEINALVNDPQTDANKAIQILLAHS